MRRLGIFEPFGLFLPAIKYATGPIASALAAPDFNWFRAALALKVGLWLQIAVNFANDYSDGVKGTDTHRIGPTRLVASGLATARSVKNAAFISFAIASIAGLWLALLTSPLLIAIGLLSILAAWNYTGGKRPYGYSGYAGDLPAVAFSYEWIQRSILACSGSVELVQPASARALIVRAARSILERYKSG